MANILLTKKEKKEIISIYIKEELLTDTGLTWSLNESSLKCLFKDWLTWINLQYNTKRSCNLIIMLNEFKYWLDQNERWVVNMNHLYKTYFKKWHGITDWFEKCTDMSDIDLYYKYINEMINRIGYLKVGDYFYYYNYAYESRQYYGIAMVGYNIEKRKKEVIFDDEGYPISNMPEWLKKEFKRTGFDYSYPESKINHIFGIYFDSDSDSDSDSD